MLGVLLIWNVPPVHRELDINAFHLTEQTAPEVPAHIEALKRDRALTRQTLDAIGAAVRETEGEITKLDSEFHNAQRALEDVSASVGPVREQIVSAAANLAAQERLIEKLDATAAEITDLQAAINVWLNDAKAARVRKMLAPTSSIGFQFSKMRLGQYLLALGHSATLSRGVDTLQARIDQGQI